MSWRSVRINQAVESKNTWGFNIKKNAKQHPSKWKRVRVAVEELKEAIGNIWEGKQENMGDRSLKWNHRGVWECKQHWKLWKSLQTSEEIKKEIRETSKQHLSQLTSLLNSSWITSRKCLRRDLKTHLKR